MATTSAESSHLSSFAGRRAHALPRGPICRMFALQLSGTNGVYTYIRTCTTTHVHIYTYLHSNSYTLLLLRRAWSMTCSDQPSLPRARAAVSSCGGPLLLGSYPTLYVYVYIYIYIYMYVCMCVYIYSTVCHQRCDAFLKVRTAWSHVSGVGGGDAAAT